MSIKNYKDLIVWQKSIELVCEIYNITKMLPKEELYGLCDQMRRASVSIPSNIAEGHARNYDNEFVKFLKVAQGSLAELETQLFICTRLDFLTNDQIEISCNLCSEIGKMLFSLISTLKNNQ